MADDGLDELYGVRPEQFTALRTALAKQAKRRGEASMAKEISAARRPTMAAWIVNKLALESDDARSSLAGLGDRLRTAHAELDGERIRALSGQQRLLVEELAREAFRLAGVVDPTAALRDDVAATLQAAIADPDVASRLGRLAKAQRWSAFGELGDAAAVLPDAGDSGDRATRPASAQPPERDDDGRREAALRAAAAQAEEAARRLSKHQRALENARAQLDQARAQHDEARKRLHDAEVALEAARDACHQSEQSAHAAQATLREAKELLAQR